MSEIEQRLLQKLSDSLVQTHLLESGVSDRKLRLWACACCRLRWHLLTHEDSRRAVEEAERYADGLTTWAALRAARVASWRVAGPPPGSSGEPAEEPFHGSREMAWAAAFAADDLEYRSMANAASECAATVQLAVMVSEVVVAGHDPMSEVNRTQAALLRDICGDPTHPVDPEWLTPTATALARGAYADRAFDRLPILADALQDAGCGEGAILDHLRGAGPHVRGCWALDLVLGRV